MRKIHFHTNPTKNADILLSNKPPFDNIAYITIAMDTIKPPATFSLRI